MRKISHLFLIKSLILTSLAFGNTVVENGAVSKVPNYVGLNTVNIHLTPEQINQYSAQTAYIQPKTAGFTALKTSLPVCKAGFSKRIHLEHFLNPLFVVGTNEASIDWLDQHHESLEKEGAIGLIISANNIAQLQAIQSHAKGMTLFPVNAQALKLRYGIPCYPILISKHAMQY